ncbi:MAG: polymer-forming cytoskeletal protein [candidate division Zixibacteria bacterium]|nr:polymer-forming cytoskeletal protein [candidate division Zixibacteria bacterium]
MDHRRRILLDWVWPLVAVAFVLLARSAGATQFRAADAVHVHNEEVLDDLFAAGGDVNVEAHIAGDLFAAGRTVTLADSAEIDNSFMGGAQRIDLNGLVHNSARLFAQDVTVRGHTERNLMVFSQNLILDTHGWVEKDVNLCCAEAIIRGRIGGDLRGSADKVTIYGQIDGDVRVQAKDLIVMPTAIIGGALKYRSTKDAKIEDGAQVLGGVEKLAPEKGKEKGYTAGSFFWDAWWFLGSLVVGGLLLVLFGPFITAMKSTIIESSWKSIGLGALFVICLPVAAVAMLLTLIGIPMAGLTILVWIVLLCLANVFVGLAIGDWALTRLRSGRPSPQFAALCLGMIILTLATAIPYAGALAKLMVVCLAFGGFFLTAYKYRTQMRA